MRKKSAYKKYSKEFKEEKVNLVLEQGYSVPQAANSLDIASNILYRRKQKIDNQRQGKVIGEEERDELKHYGRKKRY